jgi:hypothetical protein
VDGIFLSDFEQGEIGPDLFRHACPMGLGRLVSKHRESTYRGGRFRHWSRSKIGSIQRSPACRISSVEAALALGFENPAPSICPVVSQFEETLPILSDSPLPGHPMTPILPST